MEEVKKPAPGDQQQPGSGQHPKGPQQQPGLLQRFDAVDPKKPGANLTTDSSKKDSVKDSTKDVSVKDFYTKEPEAGPQQPQAQKQPCTHQARQQPGIQQNNKVHLTEDEMIRQTISLISERSVKKPQTRSNYVKPKHPERDHVHHKD